MEKRSDKKQQEEKLEEIVEDNLLRVRAQLSNGSTGKVFSFIPTERGPRWRCHACSVTVLGSHEIYKHSRSRDHAVQMVNPEKFNPEKFRAQTPIQKPHQAVLELWNLAPGEPVPPGFEGEVRVAAEIQSKLDKFQSALIGLEYLFELHNADEKEPHYICILCDKRGDPRTVMAHLTSFNHRRKYIENHFPKANLKIKEYFTKPTFKKQICHNVVGELAKWIENRFGRLTPHACDRESFERKRDSYIQTVVKDVHFTERYGETLEELVIDSAFEEEKTKSPSKPVDPNAPVPGCRVIPPAKRKSPSPPVVNAPAGAGVRRQRKREPHPPGTRRSDRSPLSSVSSLSFSDDDGPTKNRSEAYRKADFERRDRGAPIYGRDQRDRTKYPRESRSPSPRSRFNPNARFPWKRPEYAQKEKSDVSNRKRLSAETARWDEYRKGILKIENDLEHILRNHEKNPEKHPQYPEEWKKFWNRRYKELQAEHKDPSKHDFKPEWIDFWNKRMREMHEIELKLRKDSLRKRLNLPEENPQPIKFKIGNIKKQPSRDENVVDDDVIIIEDNKEEEFIPIDRRRRSISIEMPIERRRRSISPPIERRERKRSRSHSPWESDYPEIERHRKREYYNPEKRPMRYGPPLTKLYKYQEPETPDDDAQLNIVAVLRLLTALEEKLGSLGPKVIDMLSIALAMEKSEANSAETLLDNDVHCVLFETVKEKLKGQLIAGMIEPNAERPAKNAVKRIASLLHLSSERKRKREEEKKSSKPAPLSVPGVGEVDKEAIARQITTALLAQGRTNVTQEELEQLINAVVGMAQAKSTGQEVTTAEYAAKIQNEPKVTPTPTPATQILNSSTSQILNNSTAMDSLSDSDLKTLLQNFKDLSTDEQHGLISYLKKLEAHDLERVERLRKFVNLDSKPAEDLEKVEERSISPQLKRDLIDISPEDFNESREKIHNKSPDNSGFVKIDSDEDDDYTYEDVFKAASKNVKDKADELAKNTPPVDANALLNDAKLMIADIMGQIGQKNAIASASQPRNIETITSKPTNLPFLNEGNRPSSSLGNTISILNERPDSSLGSYSQLSNDGFRPNTQHQLSNDDFRSNTQNQLSNDGFRSNTGNTFDIVDERPSEMYSDNFNRPTNQNFNPYNNFNNQSQAIRQPNFPENPYFNKNSNYSQSTPFNESNNQYNQSYDHFSISPQQPQFNQPSNSYQNQNYHRETGPSMLNQPHKIGFNLLNRGDVPSSGSNLGPNKVGFNLQNNLGSHPGGFNPQTNLDPRIAGGFNPNNGPQQSGFHQNNGGFNNFGGGRPPYNSRQYY